MDISDDSYPILNNLGVHIMFEQLYAKLDSLKIERLMRTFNSIVDCAQINQKDQIKTIFTNEDTKSKQEKKYAMTLTLPEIGMDLQYEDFHASQISFKAKEFTSKLNNDSVHLNLRAVSIQDVRDGLKLASLIEGFDDSKNLVDLSYGFLTSRLEITVGNIETSLSVGVIQRLTPFLTRSMALISSSTKAQVAAAAASTLDTITVPSMNFSLRRMTLSLCTSIDAPDTLLYSFSLINMGVDYSAGDISLRIATVRGIDERNNSKAYPLNMRRILASTSQSDDRSVELDLKSSPEGTRVAVMLKGLDLLIEMETFLELGSELTEIITALSALTNGTDESGQVDSKVIADPPSRIDTKKSVSRTVLDVRLSDSRMLMVENRIIESSAALCCTSDVDFVLTMNDSSLDFSKDVIEISMRKTESFILPDVNKGGRLQVIHPFNLNLSLIRELSGKKCLRMTLELSVGGLEVQATLRDLLLMTSIVTRSITTSQSSTPQIKAPIADKLREGAFSSAPARSSTIYDLKCHSIFLVVVILSDLQQQVLPVIKFHSSLANAHLLGSDINMSGGCVVAASADYFNSQLSSWEPFIEHIEANASLKHENDESSTWFLCVDITDQQINISSLMLKTLVEICVFKSNSEHIDHGAYVQNRLGEPIDIIHGTTGSVIVNVPDEEPVILPLEASEELSRPTHPGVINIALRGESHSVSVAKGVAIAQASLRSYRVSVKKPLSLSEEELNAGRDNLEEIYENQRYSLSERKWLCPFLINDPPMWTSVATGLEVPGIKSYPLPKNWDWTSPWEVAFDSESFLDAQGFEYALNFIHFSGKTRPRQTLDAVRRRKWCRRKQLITTGFIVSDSYICTSIIEDSLKRRILVVESSIRVTNATSVDLVCSFSRETNSTADELIRKLDKYGSVYVPFTYGIPASVRFCVEGRAWSYYVSLHSSSPQDIELNCQGNDHNKFLVTSFVRNGRHLQIIVSPRIIVNNCIPFDMEFSLGVTEHTIYGGDTMEVVDYDPIRTTDARLAVGNHGWSDTFHLKGDLSLITFHQSLSPTLVWAVSAQVNLRGTLVLNVFSRAILRNNCDLDLQFRIERSIMKEKRFETVKRSQMFSAQPLADDWVTGDCGLMFVDLHDQDYFSVGIGGTWSESLIAEAVENTKVAFEVTRPEVKYQLAYSISHLDDAFDETKLLTIMHKFRILNSGHSAIFLRSFDATSAQDSIELPSNSYLPWSPKMSGKITKGTIVRRAFYLLTQITSSFLQNRIFGLELWCSGLERDRKL